MNLWGKEPLYIVGGKCKLMKSLEMSKEITQNLKFHLIQIISFLSFFQKQLRT